MPRLGQENAGGRTPAGAVDILPDPGSGARHSDRDLVLAFQEGDALAFVEIHNRYRPVAVRVCRRYLRNPDDAEEAAQETMLRVFRHLAGMGGPYAVNAWVRRVATNLCLDILRSLSRGPVTVSHSSSNGGEMGPPDPNDFVESLAQSEQVRSTLALLPERHRAALLMREVDRRSSDEIGALLGISGAQAKQLVHRARRRFRLAWTGHGRVLALPLIPGLRLPRFLRRLVAGTAPGVEVASGGERVATALVALALGAGMTAGVLGGRPIPPPGPIAVDTAPPVAWPSRTLLDRSPLTPLPADPAAPGAPGLRPNPDSATAAVTTTAAPVSRLDVGGGGAISVPRLAPLPGEPLIPEDVLPEVEDIVTALPGTWDLPVEPTAGLPGPGLENPETTISFPPGLLSEPLTDALPPGSSVDLESPPVESPEIRLGPR